MTFREKLKQEHPKKVSETFVGGCYNCPTLYGYEKTRSEGLCHGKFGNETICRACWDREMPMTQEEQEQHDLEINEEIIRGYCGRFMCGECPADNVCHNEPGMWSNGCAKMSATKQRAMLDAFEAALPPEEEEVPTVRLPETVTVKIGPEALDNMRRHNKICEELNALYRRKNTDYGDSFHRSFLEWGLTMAAVRLCDKYSRFAQLAHKHGDALVKDESMRDTLIDLANYAIMTIMELDEEGD